AVSFRSIFQSFNGKHEPDDSCNLRPAWSIQTVAITWVVMLAIIHREFVSARWRIQMPEADGQSMLHQHEVPIVDDAHGTPLLVLKFVLKIPQAVVHRLCR